MSEDEALPRWDLSAIYPALDHLAESASRIDLSWPRRAWIWRGSARLPAAAQASLAFVMRFCQALSSEERSSPHG